MLEKPVLIYDGDCGFCLRWIERWRTLTGDKIDYEPYQKVAGLYPQILVADFVKSVQLVEDSPTGRRVSSGAEAVFRSLSYNPRKRWLLGLYEKVAPVRIISELFYKLVAHNRVFFSTLTRLIWGNKLTSSTYQVSTLFFLRALAVIYAIAFLSLAFQIVGLVGSTGILPISMFLEHVKEQVGVRGYWMIPTLAWIHSGDGLLLFLCWGGFALSVLLFVGFLPNFVLFLLWAFYLSLVNAGQEFLSFQWDTLLLETGFLAIFLAPLTFRYKFIPNFDPPAVARFLLKWLLFRLTFLSGMVKLASGDEMWRTFSALQVHYETQPLPPWTAWYMHQLPELFQKFSVGVMFAAELVVPFLFFGPRPVRLTGCFLMMAFQLLIIATGNYCFFNWLAIALCILLIDDAPFSSKIHVVPTKDRKMPAWVTLPVAFLVFWVSLGQMNWIWDKKQQRGEQGIFQQWISPFRSINHYGLFAVMTPVRNEIIVEGSKDGRNWLAYEFKYKPGDLSKTPKFVAPYQPRLDWQMWFAALGNYRQNPWFINFSIRLLQGAPEVLKMIEKNPFPDSPPKYLRASLYRYRFATAKERKTFDVWWRREEAGVYCPPMSLPAV